MTAAPCQPAEPPSPVFVLSEGRRYTAKTKKQ